MQAINYKERLGHEMRSKTKSCGGARRCDVMGEMRLQSNYPKTDKFGVPAVLVSFALVCLLQGCATSADPDKMVPTDAVVKRSHTGTVDVAVTGGGETRPMMPNVSGEDFGKAVETSLVRYGVFSRVIQNKGADYRLDVELWQLQPPGAGKQVNPQLDPQKTATEGRAVSAPVMINGNETKLLTVGDQKFSLSETSSDSNSPKMAVNARCRVRTCDFLRVKQALYH